MVKHRILSCVFWSDVKCSLRKSEYSAIADRCLECSHYKRFEREMEEEEEEFWDEVDRIRKYGYPKSFHVSRRKRR